MFIDFRERGRERQREKNIDVREKHQLVASCVCPDWGSNLQPFHVSAAQANRATRTAQLQLLLPSWAPSSIQKYQKLHLWFCWCKDDYIVYQYIFWTRSLFLNSGFKEINTRPWALKRIMVSSKWAPLVWAHVWTSAVLTCPWPWHQLTLPALSTCYAPTSPTR